MSDTRSRKLAVILHADVIGSTILVRRNESIAHNRIHAAFEKFSKTIQSYGGTAHEIRGDALVAEFSRASDAVCAALVFKEDNSGYNLNLDDDIRPEIRIGLSISNEHDLAIKVHVVAYYSIHVSKALIEEVNCVSQS